MSAEPFPVVAVMGNPNTGKSTLFNRLTGMKQKVANYPGVTVEYHIGTLAGEQPIQLVDVPGTYALAAHSPDEMVAVDVLAGNFKAIEKPQAILMVIDAANLRRNMYLASQVLEMDLPVVIALNMMDVAQSKAITINPQQLAKMLSCEVIPIVASKGKGIAELTTALRAAVQQKSIASISILQDLKQQAHDYAQQLKPKALAYEIERALIDEDGYAETRLIEKYGIDELARLKQVRLKIAKDQPLAALEVKERYHWVNKIVDEVEQREDIKTHWSEHFDEIISHPVIGSLLFISVMAAVFQSVFSWATPFMNWIDGGTGWLISELSERLPENALSSLLIDGVIAGVGSVIIFLPQIIILFAFIIILEDSGYMARAAFLVDRLMRFCGLSGQSFIPMLSSFACAVPGIMATRVIPDSKDRFATILAAPFMTCSARLPVYALLIAAFIPKTEYLSGFINLQGLVLLGLYLLGIMGGIGTAFLLKKTLLKGQTPTFLMELPPYHLPNIKSVLYRLLERAKIFLKRAGTVIFTVAVIIWALAYFPHSESIQQHYEIQREALEDESAKKELTRIDNAEQAALLEDSYLGRMGKTVEPLFRPLGWDWKVSAAVIASFPAREVVIAVLGTIYSVGSEVDENDKGLIHQVQVSTHPNGQTVFTLPMVIGLLLFYAFCLQCAATVAAIRRETNTWRWPIFAWVYMTSIGYVSALFAFQVFS